MKGGKAPGFSKDEQEVVLFVVAFAYPTKKELMDLILQEALGTKLSFKHNLSSPDWRTAGTSEQDTRRHTLSMRFGIWSQVGRLPTFCRVFLQQQFSVKSPDGTI